MDEAAELSGWVGRATELRDEVTAPAMRRMAAMLDRAWSPGPGEAVPPHWLTILFDDAQPQSRLGPDGHAEKGEFLPPVPLPRRMLAGRRLRYDRPARVGDTLVRRTEIVSVTPKQGRTGRLVFVGLRHTVTGPLGTVAVEEQDIAYREAAGGTPGGGGPAREEPEPDAAWTVPFRPDPVLIFRYSALCFNGHRIHYDADYARGTEGYPGLVVNGGLTTLVLLEAALARGGGTLAATSVRTVTPLFSGEAGALHGTARDAAGRARLWATNGHGATVLRADVAFAA